MSVIYEIKAMSRAIDNERQERIQSYRDSCSSTSHRQLFNTLNHDIDVKAQGLIGSNRAEYEAQKAAKLAAADARDAENEAFWDSLM
ncbi:hypothetical protein JK202_15000 [Gluconobacter sp. Dm-62]|uniref:hypothetical protein n=1 Tax=Gluconobacter sp. Dm-62 TaxID=2799804 RepID=UPI001B8C9C64|nr:hypothetical protein [Gluconobacter sp. Dm-62]MBS1104296.1 hypothetical protein [Gluconobacter sp. Dm-62]